MKRFLAFMTFAFILFAIFVVACDDENPTVQPNTGGSSQAGAAGAEAGVGGTGNGGSAASNQGGSAGSAPQHWQKGVVGKANQGAIALAKGAGQIQGLTVYNAVTFKNFEDAGTAGEGTGGEAGSSSVPNTVPTIDLSGITPDFTELWFPVPPYKDTADQPTIKPLTAILKPDGTVQTVSHFDNWTTEFKLGCFNQTFDTTVNGMALKSFAGWSWDMADCLNRHFLVSNASNKVYELFADGTTQVITDQLPEPGVPSAIMCHPDGFLLVSMLPGYAKNAPNSKPLVGVKLAKVTLDNPAVVTQFVELPIAADYAPQSNFTACWEFTHTTMSIPTGLRLPLAIKSDKSVLVGDVGARVVYTVSADGTTATKFADMPQLTASLIYAPNEVLYMVESPILNKTATTVLQGTTIRAFDGTEYTDVLKLDGYDSYINAMSWGMYGATCPPAFANEGACKMPFGVFAKISHGATPVIYLIDPIKGELDAIPLDNPGTGGTGGSGGEAGSSGSAGEAGSAGTGGGAGSSGEAGSSGTGGEPPDASDN